MYGRNEGGRERKRKKEREKEREMLFTVTRVSLHAYVYSPMSRLFGSAMTVHFYNPL